MKPKLTAADYERGSALLNLGVAEIKAVSKVEAPRGAFLPDGQVTILYERHVFYNEVKKKFGVARADKWFKEFPNLCNPKSGGYGPAGQNQHDKLAGAVALDRDCALKSASWGMFQIMGFNHVAAGFAELQDFITAMHAGEPEQLMAFLSFLKKDKGGRMIPAIREHRWADFARDYNGPGYAANQYDKKLKEAYEDFLT